MPHASYREDAREQGRRGAQPLVLIATPDAELAGWITTEARRLGQVACVARSANGCLRVATAIGPDVVLLDARFPRELERMLRSHPATARSVLVRIPGLAHSARSPRLTKPPLRISIQASLR